MYVNNINITKQFIKNKQIFRYILTQRTTVQNRLCKIHENFIRKHAGLTTKKIM